LKEGIIIILIIALVILVFVGLFVVIFLGSLLIQRIMQRHMRILWLREEAKKYAVVDFANKPLPTRSAQEWDEEMGQRSGSGHFTSHQKPIESKKRLYQSQNPESDADDMEFEQVNVSPKAPKSDSSSYSVEHGDAAAPKPSAPEREMEPIPRPQIVRSLSGGAPGGPKMTRTFPDGLFD